MTTPTTGHRKHRPTRPWQRLSQLLRLERSDLLTLLAFALGVGLLSIVVPASIEALVNTVAFGVLLWPVVALSSRLMLVDRAVWTLLGGFDAARFPAGGADIDWCLRARAAGHELLCTGAVSASVDDGARTREIVDQHAWQLLPLDRWHHVIAGSAVVRTLSG